MPDSGSLQCQIALQLSRDGAVVEVEEVVVEAEEVVGEAMERVLVAAMPSPLPRRQPTEERWDDGCGSFALRSVVYPLCSKRGASWTRSAPVGASGAAHHDSVFHSTGRMCASSGPMVFGRHHSFSPLDTLQFRDRLILDRGSFALSPNVNEDQGIHVMDSARHCVPVGARCEAVAKVGVLRHNSVS